MSYELILSETFVRWSARLKNLEVKKAITIRLIRIKNGNFGDTKHVEGTINEIRIHTGPGYRIYYMRRQKKIVVLLCGGTKGSQKRDIAKAQKLAQEYEE